MEKRNIEVIADNFSFLENEKILSESIIDGVIFDSVRLLSAESGYVTAHEAYETFNNLCGGECNLKLFAKFCGEIISHNKTDGSNTSALSVTNTVYLRNPMTDKAYEIFSKRFTHLRAVYSHDFKSSCEDVYYDRTDSCILPLENSSDGLLMPFRNMLVKYELKIAAVTKITSSEDDLQTLALVTGGKVDTEGNVLEVCIPSVKIHQFPSLIEASKSIGCDIIRVTSVKSQTEDSYDHHISFAADSHSLSILKYFLSGISPAHIILGQYKF